MVTKQIEDITSATFSYSKQPEVYVIETEVTEVIRVEPRTPKGNELLYCYCYLALDREQKRIYEILLGAADTMEQGWISLENCRSTYSADIVLAFQALSYDHPEIFWLPHSYLLSKKDNEILFAFSHTTDKHSVDYLVSKTQRDRMQTALETKIEEIKAQTQEVTLYSTEIALHDYICNNTVYTMGEISDFVYTAYGALINGKAVCEGYARAMQLLCIRMGIPCMLISGNSDNTGHLWNLVNPGDGWYHVDLTWDDTVLEERTAYFYFNLNDAEIKNSHSVYPYYTDLNFSELSLDQSFNIVKKECNSTSYNYYVHQGLIFDEDYKTAVTNSILFAIDENKTSLEFRFATNELYEKVSADYQTYMEEIQLEINKFMGRSAPSISNIAFAGQYITIYWE